MKKLNLLVICLVVLGLVLGSFGCAAPKPVPTTPAEISFEGKTITIILPYAPGGGTDIIARVYARYLSKHLPGKPTTIVRNMPGGAYTVAVNYFYSAKPDGLTLLVGGGSVALNQLVGMKAVRYDLLKMPTLMAVACGAIFYIRSGIIDKPEDILKAKGIIYGGTPGATGYLFVCAKEVLNIPTEKVILAYSGTGDALRAFLTGETNMSYATAPGYLETIAPYVVKGEVKAAIQTGLLDDRGDVVKGPGLPPEVPTVKELYEKLYGKSPSGIAWETYKKVVAAFRNYDNPMFLPPTTPDSIVKAYWAACEAMIKDPEFRKVADPLVGGETARWMAGEACDKEFKQHFATDPKVVDWLRSTLIKYGWVVE